MFRSAIFCMLPLLFLACESEEIAQNYVKVFSTKVTDDTTKIIWQSYDESNKNKVYFKDALKYCEGFVSKSGHTQWRMPLDYAFRSALDSDYDKHKSYWKNRQKQQGKFVYIEDKSFIFTYSDSENFVICIRDDD